MDYYKMEISNLISMHIADTGTESIVEFTRGKLIIYYFMDISIPDNEKYQRCCLRCYAGVSLLNGQNCYDYDFDVENI